MVTKKKILLTAVVLGTLGLGASSSFASGPIMLSPSVSVAPKVVTTAAVHSTMQTKALATYRQIRSFWLSRAIVR
jgi:hypothetical protein